MVDTMMQTYQKKKEKEFVTQGGIKERMTAARLGYRTDQRKEMAALQNENALLRDRIDQLLQENAELRSKMK